MQRNIKQIIEDLEDIVNNNFSDQVKAIYFEKYPNSVLQKDFPVISYRINEAFAIGLNVDTFSLNIQVLDIISTTTDEDLRRKEVISDNFGIASQLVEYLRRNTTTNYYFQDNIAVTSVDKIGNDGLGGVQFTLNFELQKTCL